MRVRSLSLAVGLVGLSMVLAGCGGGGGGGGSDGGQTGTPGGSGSPSAPVASVPAATSVTIGIGLKQLQLGWNAVPGASTYRVLEDTGSGFVQVGADLPGTQTGYARDIAVHQHNWAGARYQVQSCNTEGCSTSAAVSAANGVLQAVGYFKASNTNDGDTFAWALALSADGNTLAVGAPGEASASADQANNLAGEAGAVYVFTRASSGSWSQQAYLKASNPHAGDGFGNAVALSSDGSTLVATAPLENGAATGVNGNQSLQSANDAGAAYVFVRSGASWSQQAYLKASNARANSYFGWAAALSGDGSTLAVSAVGESSAATGAGGNQADTSAADSGAVYLFGRSGSTWTQRTYLKASNTGAGDSFGMSLALNGAGSVLAVGAPFEASAATGVNGSQASNTATDAGAVYVFNGSGGSWTQAAYLKASNTGSGDNFGAALALDSAGTTLAVGAPYEASAATGVGGDQAGNTATLSGAVYLFTASGGNWVQNAYVKASNTGANDNFGSAVALAASGDTLVVGAIGESSAATGLDGNQADNSRDGVGAAYLFRRSGGSWSQQRYLKPATSQAGGEFGSTLAISADTGTLAIGASFEGSAASGIGGDQSSLLAPESGALWLY
jgi:hypothetical protein